MGDITYPTDAIDSYLDGLLTQVDIETIRRAQLKVLVDFDHGSASLVLPRAFKELNIDAVPLNAGFDETYQPKSLEAFDAARRQSALVSRTLGCQLGAYIDYGSERIFIIDDQGDVLDHHEAFGMLTLLALKARTGVVVGPATAPQSIARISALNGAYFVASKSEPSSLLRSAQQHQAVLASDGTGGYIFPEHQLSFDGIFALVKLIELLAKDGRPISAIRQEVPRVAYEHRLEACPWGVKGKVMRTMVEMHRDEAVDLLDGMKVFVDGGWVLVLPDPDLPKYHIIASVDDDGRAKELADRYSAMVRAAVAGESPPAAVQAPSA
jgi:mannose-1-phosphate guanylyltransferase/phosphomannomutase